MPIPRPNSYNARRKGILKTMWKLFVDLDEDFIPADCEKHNLGFISMPVIIDGKPTLPYVDGELKEYDPHAFFERLRGGLVPKTSGLSPEQYTEHFKPYAEKGIDVLYAHFSEAMSGTFNAMRIAVEELRKQYPTWRFEEVDTLAITGLAKAIVEEALPLYEAGKSLDEVKKHIEDSRQHFAMTLFADDLKFFKASGRVSGISAFLGGALGIKPIITMQADGCLRPTSKVAGKKKALMTVIEDIEKKGDDIANHPFIIVHSDISKELLDYLHRLVKERFGDIEIEELIVSPAPGSHAGPDCLGIAFHAKER